MIFRSPLPKLHYYHNKRIQARNPKYLTYLQLNPYPNTQSDLFCSDSSPFWCTAPNYMTNQLRGSQYATSKHQSEKIIGCNVLQLIHMMKIRKMLGHKTLWCKYITTSPRKRWTRSRTLSSVTICLNKVCSTLVQFVYNLMAVKKFFYMSKVRRKEGPLIDSRIPRKSELKSEIRKPRLIGGVEQVSTSCRALMNLHSLAWFLEQTWRLQY